MNKIGNVVQKEFLQFRRDRRMVGINFLAPIFQLIILGYAATLDVREIPTIMCDMDNSTESREIYTAFIRSGYFLIVKNVASMQDVDEYIDRGNASLAVVIPKGYSYNILSNIPAPLQIIADGSETNSATVGLNYASMIVTQLTRNILLQTMTKANRLGIKEVKINPEVRVWYNPELKSRNFMIPGVLALLLMVMTMILTSLAIVKEKEIGTMEQLIVTPMQPYQLILGKLIPFTLIGLIDIILVLLVAAFWFNVPIRGNVVLLFFLCSTFLLTTLGAGLFISTVSRNQQQAMLTAVFFVIMPMMFLSGFVFPIENMPKIIQFVTYGIPLRYFFVIVRGIFLKGAGIAELWVEGAALLGFGALILSLSIIRFQKKLA